MFSNHNNKPKVCTQPACRHLFPLWSKTNRRHLHADFKYDAKDWLHTAQLTPLSHENTAIN